ncbi:Carbamoyl-phosphate synthase small chain [hydrothermal vent metagenome]|uniref:carbamoyl-phosphate synthase (glutamine-hydrolyzing) n=1 Tax=hydrothermal vent metagenome TaxID=652676 RepID=A0A3B1A379_9ZZZZ
MGLKALLALADGTVFSGNAIGVAGHTVGEVVFNTSITGYQEILTDPSYAKQIVTLTFPHIGNVGVNAEDEESSRIVCSGLVIRDYSMTVSNWRSSESLGDYLVRHNVVAISDIDTRKLTRLLREKGAQAGCIVAADSTDAIDSDWAVQQARSFPGLQGMDLAKDVTTVEPYNWSEGIWTLGEGYPSYSAADLQRHHVVAYDFGVKRNILRLLVDRGCKVTVVPAHTPAKAVLALKPDGIFLSNGPGDPEPCDYAVAAIKELISTGVPIFGICLGYQLLALASGSKTIKMKFGHHGANHPVQDLESKEIMITSQNHGFAVDEDTLPDYMVATHRSLFDGSLQGICRTDYPAFGFQGHPEASPGPNDIVKLFDHFVDLIERTENKT